MLPFIFPLMKSFKSAIHGVSQVSCNTLLAITGDAVISVNPNKNKMNTNGIMRYVFNIFSPFSNDDCSSSKPSRIVSVCWTYYINWRGIFVGVFLEPKMGHLTANNGSFPQHMTTRVGVVSSKIAKIYKVHAGVPSSRALFFLRGGYK